ncbi:response regulator [Paenibacillus puldeungensis]
MENYCKVLIVDDEMLVRQGIKHLFNWEKEGFTMIGEASNGQEALDLIPILKPHILLLDIVMPVMDGEELAGLVKSRYPDIEIVVLSSFSEFEYVRSSFQNGAADYILKPKMEAEQLLNVLKQIAGRTQSLHKNERAYSGRWLITTILDKLIAGYPAEDDMFVLQSALPHPLYVLLVLQSLEPQKKYALEVTQPRIESMLNSVTLYFPGNIRCQALSPDGGQLRFLLNFEPSQWTALKELAERLAEEYARENEPILAALSREFEDLSRLYQIATEEMPMLLEQHFFLPHLHVFTPDQIAEPIPIARLFSAEAFAEELNDQQFLAAFRRLKQFVAALPGRRDIHSDDFKSFLGQSVFNIILVFHRFNFPAERLDAKKYDYFRSIHESRNIHEAAQITEQFLAEAEGCVLERKRSSGAEPMQKLLHYIHEHYAEPLSLSELALHFHFNPSYLSNYFATHNKEGFSEYLNRVRIERACDLLNHGDVPISEISTQVGYSDHSYFTKVFRKQRGMSPSQYRKRMQEGYL